MCLTKHIKQMYYRDNDFWHN